MRHSYTPIFREFTTSSMWAQSCEMRCVWIWMLLNADPEGFVPGTVPGLAVAANVPLPATREAIEVFLSPDPDSNNPANEGRRIEKVDHGWRVLNIVYWRELAKREAEKARKRKWAAANGKRPPVANDNEPPVRLVLDATSETLDAPKPKSKPSLSEERSPLPPVGDISRYEGDRFDVPTRRLVLTSIPKDWQLSDELRAEAILAGVPPADIDPRIADLRTGPIGGQRGVFADELDDYVRNQFGKWKTWAETDRAKAQRAAEAGPGRRFGGGDGSPAAAERKRVLGAPAWVYQQHADFAKQHGLDLPRAAKAYARQAHVVPDVLKPADVFEPFMTFLKNLAEERAREASA